jgi:hypothetical protein
MARYPPELVAQSEKVEEELDALAREQGGHLTAEQFLNGVIRNPMNSRLEHMLAVYLLMAIKRLRELGVHDWP